MTNFHEALLNTDPPFTKAEERGPEEYIDVTRARRHETEDINWPRPG